MKIVYETIPHCEQRYETVGDWFWDADGVLQIRVSELGDPRFERLVFIHEIVEVLIETARQSITAQELADRTDGADKAFEDARTNDTDEPGYQPTSPVYHGHMAASAIEHIAAMLMGVDYNEYNRAVAALHK